MHPQLRPALPRRDDRRRRRTARSTGFTLIELMAVLAVMAVLGAVALPNYGARTARARLHGTAQMLAADVAQARFEAARRGLPLVLQAHAGSDARGWCWAVASAPDCPCGQGQACEISHVASSDHPGVALAGALDLRFDPAGGVLTPAVVRLTSARGERVRVDVSPLGRARVCSETGSSSGVPAC